MHLFRFFAFLLFATLASPATGAEWQSFVIPSTGTRVEMPVSTFTEETELPDGGVGRRFFTSDRRADLTVQSVENPGEDFTFRVPREKKSASGDQLSEGNIDLLCRFKRS